MMRGRIRGILAVARHLTVVVAITIAATLMLRLSTANAVPVEYVKICSLFGTGFFYLPGTDICINFATNDARQATEGGVWRWRVPNNPRTWVTNPGDACHDGHLVKFGDITSSDLTQNSYSRYETKTHYRLKLKQGQYIASVLYKGGFTTAKYLVSQLPACPSANRFVSDATDSSCTAGDAPIGGGTGACDVACVSGAWQFTGNYAGGVEPGNFCMYYYYTYDPSIGPVYSFPLGCIDTSSQAALPETLQFSPDSPIPPATVDTDVLGANGNLWKVTSTAEIQGKLSVWLCLQNAPGSGPHHSGDD